MVAMFWCGHCGQEPEILAIEASSTLGGPAGKYAASRLLGSQEG